MFQFDAALLGIFEILGDVAIAPLLHDLLFYHVHRLFHSTMTEYVLANVTPVLLPLIMLKVHVVTFWIVLGLGLVHTTTVHSGYDFFAAKARDHDAHHEKFLVNFGSTGLLDWWYGTAGGDNDKVN